MTYLELTKLDLHLLDLRFYLQQQM